MHTKKSIFTYTLYFIIIASIAWVGYYLTPMLADDIPYHFRILKSGFGDELNSSWHDTWNSILNLRYIHNGRLGNSLFILFAYLGSKDSLNILHALFFSTLIFIVSFYCFHKININSLLITLLSLLLFLPHPDRIFFWSASANTYLWSSVILMVYLCLIEKIQENKINNFNSFFTYLTALLCGWMHEGLGAPLLVGLTCYYTWLYFFKKEKCPYPIFISLIFIAIGLAISLSAPSIWNRVASASSPSYVGSIFKNIICSIGLLFLNFGLSLLVFIFSLIFHFKWDKKHIFWLFLIIPSLIISSMFGIQGSWGGAYYFSLFLISLFILRKWAILIQYIKLKTSIIIVSVLVSIICYFYYTSYNTYITYQHVLNKAKTHRIITIDGYTPSKHPSWFLISALPGFFEENKIYHLISRFYHTHRFMRVFNLYVKDKSIYEKWQSHSGHTCHVFKENNKYFIRAPKNHVISIWQPSLHARTNSGETVALRVCWTEQGKAAPFLNLIGHRIGHVGEDYHMDFYYLIVPDNNQEYVSLHFDLVNLENKSMKRQTISLINK